MSPFRPAPKSPIELELFLAEHSVPVSTWGEGTAKTVGDLLAELIAGESHLSVDERGRLVRRVAVVGVDVFFSGPGQGTLRLVETCQTFTSGRERTRTLRTSLGEKRLPGETAALAAARALEEELGMPAAGLDIRETGCEVTAGPSASYPGLSSERYLVYFECDLPAALFVPEGYEERQSDKTTHFAWQPV